MSLTQPPDQFSERHVFLCVSRLEGDPSVVTQIMGIEPTKAWAKGDPLPRHPLVSRRFSRWTLQSRLPLVTPIELHLGDLLDQLESRADRVAKLVERYDAFIWIAAYFTHYNAVFSLSPELLRRIAALGLVLHFDQYYFRIPKSEVPSIEPPVDDKEHA